MKRTRTFLVVARKYGLLLSILAVPLLIAAENGFPTWEDYNAETDSIAGIWISSQQNSPEDNPYIWTETITPLDDTGMRYAYRAWSPNPGVNYGWLGLTESRVHGLALGQLVQTLARQRFPKTAPCLKMECGSFTIPSMYWTL